MLLLLINNKYTAMKKIVIVNLVILLACCAYSQDMKNFKLYKTEENAEQEISRAAKEAKKENKNVLIQIGGNWCIWCARFYDFVAKDSQLDSLMNANFVVYHMNYSKENYNVKLLAKYKYPQRFGFPVFLILDNDGKLIHTQNSWYLEDGQKSYDKEKVKAFFNDWGVKAFDPKQYKEQ